MKNVLLIASEAVPFIKTGGLADVAGSLPKYFDKTKFDVRVMIPKYTCIPWEYREKMVYKTHFYIDLAWRTQYVGVFELEWNGVTFYFIDNEFYFGGNKPYSWIHEDIEKFAFFSKAALSALPVLGFRPDIIHCNDWQTGLIPVYLKERFSQGEFYQGIKSIMTIHNLKFQGIWDLKKVKDITGLPDEYFTSDKLEAYDDANYLKGGIVYADRVTTVSETYAEEIKTPFYGENLDGLMRARSNVLSGIVNGIDYDEYNPETDKRIYNNYNQVTFRKEKWKNKVALQKELGLTEDKGKFMIGLVSRLTDQKGLDLVAYVMDQLCAEDVQFVVLGTGEESIVYADRVTTVSETYAEEIKTPFYGENLDGLMRARSNVLSGIVNGIDYDEYNPETDKRIYNNYNQVTFRKEKWKNKVALQKELGLTEDKGKFMIGLVSRLTDQKGLDLVAYVMDQLCAEDVQFVVLGTGEERYENMFRHYDWKYNDRVSANIYYSEDMSHKVYAACDAFLMPSLFEPCGLSQLMSLRYGTVPIVRETGGLKDTVEPYNEYEGKGTGFSFANYNAHEMLGIVNYAKDVYYNHKREWNKIVDRGMKTDFSWNSSARKYEELYNSL